MSAEELDELFDNGGDITPHLELATSRRQNACREIPIEERISQAFRQIYEPLRATDEAQPERAAHE
jgi:hypothetical protein